MQLDDATLQREVSAAAESAVAARHKVDGLPPGSPEFRDAMLDYLQATVLHLAIVSVIQAREHEELALEIAELRDMIGPVKVH